VAVAYATAPIFLIELLSY